MVDRNRQPVSDEKPDADADRADPPPAEAKQPPPAEEEEMGGESACQLHRFWNVEE